MGVNLQFLIDGREFIAPKEWKDLKETLVYGKGATEATIESEKLTFVGDAMLYIKSKYDKGHILRPIEFEAIMVQGSQRTTFFENYIIDLTKGVNFIYPTFGNIDVPLSVECNIRRKLGFDSFIQEIQGLSFDYLLSEGYVSKSNYSDVKVTVLPVNNAKSIALALLSLMILRNQIQELISKTRELILDIQQKLTSSVTSAPSAIVYAIVVFALRAAELVVLAANITTTMNQVIKTLKPPVIKDKGMTWRNLVESVIRGYNGSLNNYNVVLSCDFDEFDTEVLYPSLPHTNSLKLTEKIKQSVLPYYAPNDKGIPTTNDSWYLGGGLFELVRKRFNAVFYFDGNTLNIKTKGDSTLYELNSYKPSISPLLESGIPNITDIPQTTLYSFVVDYNDDWTTENYKGTSFEVKNLSKYTRLTGLNSIELPIALGSTKTDASIIEKILIKMGKVADLIAGLVGGSPNLEQSAKLNSINILKVSQRNHSVGKLLPIQGGNMLKMPTNRTSAKQIENKYYYNERVKTGDAQKILYKGVKLPFVLQDRNKIRNNSQFIDSNGNKATFDSIDWTFAKDEAIANYYINNKYIADDDIEEKFIEPE